MSPTAEQNERIATFGRASESLILHRQRPQVRTSTLFRPKDCWPLSRKAMAAISRYLMPLPPRRYMQFWLSLRGFRRRWSSRSLSNREERVMTHDQIGRDFHVLRELPLRWKNRGHRDVAADGGCPFEGFTDWTPTTGRSCHLPVGHPGEHRLSGWSGDVAVKYVFTTQNYNGSHFGEVTWLRSDEDRAQAAERDARRAEQVARLCQEQGVGPKDVLWPGETLIDGVRSMSEKVEVSNGTSDLS